VGAGPGSSGSVACRADHPLSDGRLEVECAVEVVVAVVAAVVVAAADGVRRAR
jgi:hypothetical protein